MTAEQIERAKELRAAGWTYKAIGRELGYSDTAIINRLNPHARENKRQYDKGRWRAITPERLDKVRSTQGRRDRNRCRFRRALGSTREFGKKRGYAPCIATVEEVKAAFTGYCHLCGVPESQCRVRLSLDHDHVTGKFRGWLCKNCNTMLAQVSLNPAKILTYLAKGTERGLTVKFGQNESNHNL